ncbi:MAG: ParA family protein [Burkholderiaceae bacterium]
MPVIAVVNRKGGSGKSTLATHLAAYCANNSISVMLGDVDRQQSTQPWLKLREAQPVAAKHPSILGWAIDPKNVMRAPQGISHVVLDTPGGLRGLDLARVVGYTDAILMPVCNSVFDRESAADCYAELMTLPRVASGKCKVAAVGMRIDARTKAAQILSAWAQQHDIAFIGVLRDTQAYVRCIERGLTLFDLPAEHVRADIAQWQPVLDWLEPVLRPAPQVVEAALHRTVRPCYVAPVSAFNGLTPAVPIRAPTAGSPRPPAEYASPTAGAAVRTEPLARPTLASRFGRLLDFLPSGRTLQRTA